MKGYGKDFHRSQASYDYAIPPYSVIKGIGQSKCVDRHQRFNAMLVTFLEGPRKRQAQLHFGSGLITLRKIRDQAIESR